MEEETIKELKKQHIDNYRNAIYEVIRNNTNALVDDDIMSLIRKPPLDSMDLIRTKFLNLAKKYKIILNTDELSNILEEYRDNVASCCKKIKKMRIKELSSVVDHCSFSKDDETIIFYKKNFVSLNKNIKKVLKDQLNCSFELKMEKKLNKIFNTSVDNSLKEKIIVEIVKFMKTYHKQLLENFDK